MHLILRRIAGDVKQYKWAAAAFLIYYFVVRSVFHAFCPPAYSDRVSMSWLRYDQGCDLYFYRTVC